MKISVTNYPTYETAHLTIATIILFEEISIKIGMHSYNVPL